MDLTGSELGPLAGPSEHHDGPSVSKKGGEILDCLDDI
jgi:hypothetical protein